MTTQTLEPRLTARDRLLRIREEKDSRIATERILRADACLARAGRLLHTLDFVERVRDRIAACLGDLQRADDPGLSIDQRLVDGCWVMAARTVRAPALDERGHPRGDGSQIRFLMETDQDADRLRVTCRPIHRGHDAAPTTLEIGMHDESLPALGTWVEDRVLDFAGHLA